MLWPKGERELKARVIAAVLLVLAGKAAVLLMPFAYKAVIDRMSRACGAVRASSPASSPAYATARFAGVLSDNLRNALFEKVGQDAARRLAGQVFRHVHDLSLRFHLERRTGSLTKIVERGTKSIDMMLYFLLFNIGPDADRADRGLRHLLRQVRRRPGRRDAGDGRRSTSPSRAR